MSKKLRKLLAFHDEAAKSTTSLTENAHSYYNNVLKPIQRCYVNHCESDSSKFLQRWDISSAYTKFGWQECHGRGKCGSQTYHHAVNIYNRCRIQRRVIIASSLLIRKPCRKSSFDMKGCEKKRFESTSVTNITIERKVSKNSTITVLNPFLMY